MQYRRRRVGGLHAWLNGIGGRLTPLQRRNREVQCWPWYPCNYSLSSIHSIDLRSPLANGTLNLRMKSSKCTKVWKLNIYENAPLSIFFRPYLTNIDRPLVESNRACLLDHFHAYIDLFIEAEGGLQPASTPPPLSYLKVFTSYSGNEVVYGLFLCLTLR